MVQPDSDAIGLARKMHRSHAQCPCLYDPRAHLGGKAVCELVILIYQACCLSETFFIDSLGLQIGKCHPLRGIQR